MGPFFQSYLRRSQDSKVPIAPYSRCYSAQIKDRGELWRTKGGCPIFRLPLAGSCTGHILQGRTKNLSTTSLSPPTSYTEMAAILLPWFTDLSYSVRKLHLGVSKHSAGNFESSSDVSCRGSRTARGQREQAAWAANQSPAGCRGSARAVALQAHPSIKKPSRITQQSRSFISPPHQSKTYLTTQ